MASVRERNGSWRLIFQHNLKQHAVTIGKVSETEAHQWKARTENLLMRVRQNLLEIPRGVSVTDFILHDGKPPLDPDLAKAKDTTLHQLRKSYIDTFSNGAIEKNTLYTAGIHLDHIEETFTGKFLLAGLTMAKLQKHIDRRAKSVAPVTIKKEIDTFRAAWNWGMRMKWVDQPFPSAGLVYSKTDDKLPFMTWSEIERRIKASSAADDLWECLYLQDKEIESLLTHVRKKKVRPWIYPAVVMAAHTGARKSEIIRARVEDVDFKSMVLTVREKKRAKGIRTTRRVNISTKLAEALRPLVARQQGKAFLFGEGENLLSVQAMHKALARTLDKSKWSVIRGWHVLRHSFISALASAGVDQRIIDDFVGHQTPQQQRRYRHLYPNVTAAAITKVFG